MLETKFLTSVVEKRKPIFDRDGDDFIAVIEESLAYFVNKGDFQLHAYVIMPNHIHVLYSKSIYKDSFRIPFLRFTARAILRKKKQEASDQ